MFFAFIETKNVEMFMFLNCQFLVLRHVKQKVNRTLFKVYLKFDPTLYFRINIVLNTINTYCNSCYVYNTLIIAQTNFEQKHFIAYSLI